MSLKKRIVALLVLVLLSATALFSCLYFADNALRKLPESAQANLNLSEGEPIKVSYFDKISERVKTKYYSFTSESEPINIKGTEVTKVYTTFSYFEILDISLSGQSFTEKDQLSLKRKAIISDTLALKLYFNTDAVGEIIEIEGEEYIVSGVFEESRNLIDEFSKDGKERIYIPYTCAENSENLPVHTIVYDIRSNTAPVIEQINIPQYHFTSFSEKAKVLESVKHIMCLILYSGLVIVALYFWRRILSYTLKKIGENLKENYFLKSLTSIPLKYLLLVLVGAGVPAVLLFVFVKSDLSIYIVSKYIPYDNLFDVSHYIKCLLENAQLTNSLVLIGDTYLLNLYCSTFCTCLWVSLIFLIFYISSFINLFSILKNPED